MLYFGQFSLGSCSIWFSYAATKGQENTTFKNKSMKGHATDISAAFDRPHQPELRVDNGAAAEEGGSTGNHF